MPGEDFLRKLLELNPRERMTPKDARDHVWLAAQAAKEHVGETRSRRSRTILVVLGPVVVVAGALASSAEAADAPTAQPRALVVALGLQSPALQAGVVRGRDVILARGFEVELARVLALRLGGRVERFVYVPSSARLLASGATGWHLALAGIEPGRGGRSAADLSAPYLTTDVAVVARPGLEQPRRLTDLRTRVLCAVRGSEATKRISRGHL